MEFKHGKLKDSSFFKKIQSKWLERLLVSSSTILTNEIESIFGHS